MNNLMSRTVMAAALLVAAAGLSGCGDVVANQGNLGNLVYALFTDYNVSETKLTEVKLITGVEHRIVVTEAPDADVSGKSEIVHLLAPEQNTTITTEPPADGGIGDAVLKVDAPGVYTLQSWKGTELVDYVALTFVDAVALDAMTFVLQPGDEEFARAETTTPQVNLYSQATFIAAPVDADGDTVVGDIGLDIAVSPADAAVEVYNITSAYENQIWESPEPINLLFVKTGNVDVTLTEPLTGLSSTISFTVLN